MFFNLFKTKTSTLPYFSDNKLHGKNAQILPSSNFLLDIQYVHGKYFEVWPKKFFLPPQFHVM